MDLFGNQDSLGQKKPPENPRAPCHAAPSLAAMESMLPKKQSSAKKMNAHCLSMT
jgi:hypothetical protein